MGRLHRTQVAAETFGKLDHYLWRLTLKWAKVSHPNKPTHWVFAQYFGKFNKARQDRWVSGSRNSGAYLHRFAWTNIVRHQIVKHQASPDDPALADYRAWRRRKAPLPINRTALWLHREQRRTLRDLQELPRRRRGPATNPAPVGDVAGQHPQDNRCRMGTRQDRQGCTPSHPPRLQTHPPANRACLSRMLGNGHVRF